MAYTTIDDPSEYFTDTLYVGNATARSITNSANAGNFQPDFLWIKVINNANNHRMFDSSRGHAEDLKPNLTEGGEASSDRCTGFDANGFSLGNNAEVNSNGHNIVAWQWKVNGGTTSTNDASSTGVGDIDSVIQANQEAGISLVTYTGTDTAGETFAHGLGSIPDMVIIKRRGADGDAWAVQLATLLGNTNALRLNENAVYGGGNGVGFWNDTSPTSTVMSLGDRAEINSASTNTYMAYFFKSIQGYSKVGKYEGNGNDSGPVVYLGFKPAWVMIKCIDTTQHWNIPVFTTKANGAMTTLSPNLANSERNMDDNPAVDFLSNGFKIRTSDSNYNDSGDTFIYLAFAERPFVTSEGVPTVAR